MGRCDTILILSWEKAELVSDSTDWEETKDTSPRINTVAETNPLIPGIHPNYKKKVLFNFMSQNEV